MKWEVRNRFTFIWSFVINVVTLYGNAVIPLYGNRILVDLLWSICNVYKFKSLCCMPETNNCMSTILQWNNNENSKGWQVCGEIGTSEHCWWECKIMEKSLRVPQKAKHRTALQQFHFYGFA